MGGSNTDQPSRRVTLDRRGVSGQPATAPRTMAWRMTRGGQRRWRVCCEGRAHLLPRSPGFYCQLVIPSSVPSCAEIDKFDKPFGKRHL